MAHPPRQTGLDSHGDDSPGTHLCPIGYRQVQFLGWLKWLHVTDVWQRWDGHHEWRPWDYTGRSFRWSAVFSTRHVRSVRPLDVSFLLEDAYGVLTATEDWVPLWHGCLIDSDAHFRGRPYQGKGICDSTRAGGMNFRHDKEPEIECARQYYAP